jgi:hypothetical protein
LDKSFAQSVTGVSLRPACLHELRRASAPARPWLRIRPHETPGEFSAPGRHGSMQKTLRLVMPQERYQYDDRNGHPDQPQQQSSSQAHVDVLSFVGVLAG